MQLYLYEEIMLLALRDEKGTILTDFIEYSVAGAVIAELLLQQRISVSDDKHKTVNVINKRKIGDPIIDECLSLLIDNTKSIKLANIVSEFASIKKLRDKVASQLCQRGIVKEDEQKILLIFTRKTYPEINPKPEQDIIKRMESAMFQHNHQVAPRTLVLIALADSASLLAKNFNRDRLKTNEAHIKRLVKGDIAGAVNKEVIAACEAVVLVTVIMPAIMSTVLTTTVTINS